MDDNLCELSDEPEFAGEDDLFSIFESLDGLIDFPVPFTPLEEMTTATTAAAVGVGGGSTQKPTPLMESETEETSPKTKRQKLASLEETMNTDGPQRISHITVERNRRKQMNEHLSVLRSLMPCFYVKRVSQTRRPSLK